MSLPDNETVNEWKRRMKEMEDGKKAQTDRIKTILKQHGIEMEVGGCGCCGSPWVTFVYRGEKIADGDELPFDTRED